MDALLWILLPVLVAAGSAILCTFMMQARNDVAISKEREVAARLQAELEQRDKTLVDKVKAAEEGAYRRAFDQFLMDFRVEERHYIRESRSHFMTRKAMVMQERLYFRNIPLSNWVEHEMALDDGSEMQLPAAQDASVFSARSLSDHGKFAPKYLPQ